MDLQHCQLTAAHDGDGGMDLPGNTVFVLDLLGNSSVRFKQSDDGDSLPGRLGGSWHILGEVRVMSQEQVEKTLSNMEHFTNMITPLLERFSAPPFPSPFTAAAVVTFVMV